MNPRSKWLSLSSMDAFCLPACSSWKIVKPASVNLLGVKLSAADNHELRARNPSIKRALHQCEQFAESPSYPIAASAYEDRSPVSSSPAIQMSGKHVEKVRKAVVQIGHVERTVASRGFEDVRNGMFAAERAELEFFRAKQRILDHIHTACAIACLRSERCHGGLCTIAYLSDLPMSNVYYDLELIDDEVASAAGAIEAGRAAMDGGISVLEVTMRTPGAAEVIKTLVHEYPSALIGAGTVLTWQDAESAKDAGAKYLLSPISSQDLIQAHHDSRVLFIPGAMTATEVLNAYRWGAACVKLYPVSLLGGIQYVQTLKNSFPYISFIASNGITAGTMESYLHAGATAVVLSDAIFDKSAMINRDYTEISKRSAVATALASSIRRRL